MPEIQIQQSIPLQSSPTYDVDDAQISHNMASEIPTQAHVPNTGPEDDSSLVEQNEPTERTDSLSNSHLSTHSPPRQEEDSDADEAPTPPSDALSVTEGEGQLNGDSSVNQTSSEDVRESQNLRAGSLLSDSAQSEGELSSNHASPVLTVEMLTQPNGILPQSTDPTVSSEQATIQPENAAPPSMDAVRSIEDGVQVSANSDSPSNSAPDLPSEESNSPVESDVPPPDTSADEETPKGEEGESKEKAFWVDLKEDTSVPDEAEVKEIEEAGQEHSAHDHKYFEDQFYSEEDDPEFRPSKKIRLTWILKGIRGTKERPNYARVINSPAAKVGDFYWRLKFFPRGNNSRSLSCYIKCSKSAVDEDEESLETKFHWFEGPGNVLLGNKEPQGELSFPATHPKSDQQPEGMNSPVTDEVADKNEAQMPREPPSNVAQTEPIDDGWRVPAQIGVVVYNPDEPRTNHYNSSCHQFNKGNDDWGWTNFQPEGWNEIHSRQRFQRQALLRNDTLAFDAYIRVFEDPTQRLWFHTSESESFWDGLSVTGYRAFGTPPLRHSPGVAGLASLLHLAPFRKIVQAVQIDKWRTDARIRPCPITTATQAVLYLMRRQRKRQEYVDVYRLLELMMDLGEKFQDVLTFWERFRRSIELEIRDQKLIRQMSQMFDIQPRDEGASIERDPLSRQQATLQISCGDASSVSEGLGQLDPGKYSNKILPEFLTVDLGRQTFDSATRAWKLRYNRVRLDDELDLQKLVPHQSTARYTLYGFIVHCGERNSGHFYSVIRPDGPGTKWLAFEDGDGNKILIQTKRTLKDFEGLEGTVLDENTSTRQTAYVAMYLKTNLLKEYLPGRLEPWDIPSWLKSSSSVRDHLDEKVDAEHEKQEETNISLEIYDAKNVHGRPGMLDVHSLKVAQSDDVPVIKMTVPFATTYFELRHKLANIRKVDDVQKIRFWTLGYHPPLDGLNNTVKRITAYSEPVGKNAVLSRCCLWYIVLKDSDVKLFGMPEPRSREEKDLKELPHGQTTTSGVEQSREEASDAATGPVPHPEDMSARDSMTGPVVGQSNAQELTQEQRPESLPSSGTVGEILMAPEVPTNATSERDPPSNQDRQLSTPPAREEATPPNTEDFTEARLNEAAIAAMVAEEVAAFDAVAENSQGESTSLNLDGVHVATAGISNEISNSVSTANQAGNALDPGATDSNSHTPDALHDDTQHTAVTASAENEQQSSDSSANENLNDATEVTDDHSDSSSEPDEEIALQPHTCKFVQVFDAHKQEIKTAGNLFAPKDSSIKESVRHFLGWANDKKFHMWWLEAPYRTKNISPDAVFDNCESHSDASVILVGEVLIDSEYVRPLLRRESLADINTGKPPWRQWASLVLLGQPCIIGGLRNAIILLQPSLEKLASTLLGAIRSKVTC